MKLRQIKYVMLIIVFKNILQKYFIYTLSPINIRPTLLEFDQTDIQTDTFFFCYVDIILLH